MTDKWYQGGLRFQCTQCGKCCTGSPGYVWIDENEIAEMAAFLKISVEKFVQLYTRKINGNYSLLEDKKSFDCIFLRDKKCQVYGARPQQCRKFPWWPENVATRKDWEEAATRCEGINHPDAPLIPFGTIQNHLAD